MGAMLELITDPVNQASLEAIESCMFILCLDQSMPLSFNHQQSIDETCKKQRDDVSLALQMIHGHGATHNSANRWYDKTMQVRRMLSLSLSAYHV